MVVTNKKLINFLYKNDIGFSPLPTWTNFYIELGEHISRLVSDDTRWIVALAVPTRTFCASLISFGFIASRASLIISKNHTAHAEYLKSLSKGTPVVLRSQSGKDFKGIYMGFIAGDQLYFGVQYEKNNSSTIYISVEKSKRIEVLNDECYKLPRTQKGRTASDSSQFCEAILGDKCSHSFISTSYLESVIIGPKNLLRKEISEQIFATQNNQTGTLQEIIRVKEFQSNTMAYRSRIISDRIRATPVHSKISDPPLTIFDGSQSFLKWRSFWKGSNWVVVLEKAEYQFYPATEQIKREYALNSTNNTPAEFTTSEIPPGIEMTVFEVSAA